MRSSRLRRCGASGVLAGVCTLGMLGARPEPAEAFNPLKAGCTLIGAVNPAVKKACTVAQIGVGAVSAVKSLLGSQGTSSAAAASSNTSASSTALGLSAIGTWVLGGAVFALHETAKVLSQTTAPQLESTWFSSTYWRVAAIAVVLTLPFLFAAAVQALIRSDATLLLKAALGYLPLAMLAVAIAAPLTALLLAASDELANAVSSAAGNASTHFLHVTGLTIGALTVLTRSPFMVFLVGLLTVGGAVSLWIELLVREAAVYVIVLMLPLVFAAMVWPARRVWAVRAVELLVALILSKFAIVAVLSLGGAAISKSQGFSVSALLAGVVLLGMGVFAPWALLRLIPLAELASNASTYLRQEGRIAQARYREAGATASRAEEQWTATIAAMRRDDEGGLSALPGADGALTPPHDRGAEREDAEAGYPDEAPLPDRDRPDLVEPDLHGASRQPSAVAADDGPEPRISGLPEMWQRDDLSWNPVILGPEGVEGGQVSPPSAPPARDGRDGLPPRPERDLPADDHDPTPPLQAPPEGRL